MPYSHRSLGFASSHAQQRPETTQLHTSSLKPQSDRFSSLSHPSPPSQQPDTASCTNNNKVNDEQKSFPVPDGSTAFSDNVIAFALDCSGSTRGHILKAEYTAIRRIAAPLSPEAHSRALVLPWNHTARPVLSLKSLGSIKSEGGTNPTVLNDNPAFRSTLQQASLWCLLTDGIISNQSIRAFAAGICNTGLHGTPSIIVLAGQRTGRPVDCNISVGKAVFAVTAHCLFLFHDVARGVAFALQTKGCFDALLPTGYGSIVLDETTSWQELPVINYSALQALHIPKKAELDPDTIMLVSGKSLDLNDIYNDRVGDAVVAEILGNNQDLNTLLMAASVRDRQDDIQKWMTSKNIPVVDPIWTERLDQEDRCLTLTKLIITALQGEAGEPLQPLQQRLRESRKQNWDRFSTTLIANHRETKLRDVVISDATKRLVMDIQQPSSASLLSAVSPSLMFSKSSRISSKISGPVPTALPTPKHPKSDSAPVPLKRNDPEKFDDAEVRTTLSSLLYTRGYRALPDDDSFHTDCEICGEQGIAALLLKPSSPEMERDVVVPEICCEACSVFLERLGRSRKGEVIGATLPLVSRRRGDLGGNLSRWKSAAADVFGERSDGDGVLRTLLARFRATIDEASEADAARLGESMRALRWACESLAAAL